jgi:hypothetical protein
VSQSTAIAALGLVAVAGIGAWCWFDREPAPVTPAAPAVVAPTEPKPSALLPVQADLQPKVAEAKPAAKEPAIRFPDGSTMPALNGVTSDVVIQWGTRPFTKIIGTEDGPNGWKWYVHENGTRSTTAMIDMNGVPSPTGLVAEPTTALPTRMEFEEGLKNGAGGSAGGSGKK